MVLLRDVGAVGVHEIHADVVEAVALHRILVGEHEVDG